ncbi:hypothetical protein DSO57_1019307 [Entomophthora muscae]|uniref:Uncharacterized protein n=1 Tax=Entomophthora muscae TaxID=34485 RepID=A0ACC2RV33_9FUNG|nr:hypothetical protein DSO57_1019307 [Entomophthora muscae]
MLQPLFKAMQGNFFLFRFLASFLSVVLTLENPTPTTDWHNSSPDNSHQKEFLAHGWFKYPSGHWGRKFHYGCASSSPSPVKPSLVRPNTSFYLLTYLVGYYLLGSFSSMMGRFAYLGHFGHLAMVTVPIGLVIAGLNVGALAHQIGNLFPLKWVLDTLLPDLNPLLVVESKASEAVAWIQDKSFSNSLIPTSGES